MYTFGGKYIKIFKIKETNICNQLISQTGLACIIILNKKWYCLTVLRAPDRSDQTILVLVWPSRVKHPSPKATKELKQVKKEKKRLAYIHIYCDCYISFHFQLLYANIIFPTDFCLSLSLSSSKLCALILNVTSVVFLHKPLIQPVYSRDQKKPWTKIF